jgi:hypothetical protein
VPVPAAPTGRTRADGAGPAGLITSSVQGVLAFARLHLDGGVTPDGTRLLSETAAEDMRRQRAEIPGSGDPAAVGLGWRLHRWGDRRIFGHDGGTIGQTAYLRIDPEARLIACLLTNSPQSQSLFQRLFSEVFGAYAGVAVPPGPAPAAQPANPGLERHAGRYERASMRYDVSVRDGRLHMVAEQYDERGAFSDEGPHEFDLYPADGTGDNFVVRSDDGQPWSPLTFGRFGAGAVPVYQRPDHPASRVTAALSAG